MCHTCQNIKHPFDHKVKYSLLFARCQLQHLNNKGETMRCIEARSVPCSSHNHTWARVGADVHKVGYKLLLVGEFKARTNYNLFTFSSAAILHQILTFFSAEFSPFTSGYSAERDRAIQQPLHFKKRLQ